MTPRSESRHRTLVLLAMCLALASVLMSVSGLNVALGALAADLQASQTDLLWIVDGYVLAFAALLLPLGAVADRVGRKPILLAGLGVFSAASIGSSLAGSPEALITTRVAAGIGAAMVMPVTLAVITNVFPEDERPKAVGVWTGVAGIGGILGLILSAVLVDRVSWPWLFVPGVAVAAAAAALVVPFVPNSAERTHHRFDLVGGVLSVAAIAGLVYALIEGPVIGWSDLKVVTAAVVCVAALAGFVLVELRAEAPLLDVRVFTNRGVSSGSVVLAVTFLLSIGVFLTYLQYLQGVLGFSALAAAGALWPLIVPVMALAPLSGTLASKVGSRPVFLAGTAAMAAGMVGLAVAAGSGTYAATIPGLAIFGVGMGLASTPATLGITSGLSDDHQGVASALNDMVREVGGAIGVALLGAVLTSTYQSSVQEATTALPPGLQEAVELGIGPANAAAAALGDAGAPVLDAAADAFQSGFRAAALAGAAVAIGATIAVAFLAPRRRDPAHETTPTLVVAVEPAE